MASVNKVILIGNLGKDPETRYAPSGDAICNITLATTDTWRDKATGEKREATEWHRVVFFGKLAEIAGQYLRKGSAAYIEGPGTLPVSVYARAALALLPSFLPAFWPLSLALFLSLGRSRKESSAQSRKKCQEVSK